MRLTDVMSGAGLAVYAEIALVLFLAAFVVVVIFLVWRRKSDVWETARHLPLEDDRILVPRRSPQERPTNGEKGEQHA